MISWWLAWNRFEWFAFFQRHTFPMLWIGYIGIINALCYKRSLTCPVLEYPANFLALFVLSACFWWFFEYLNRFVQNWYYLGVEGYTSVGYVFFATVSFSTVLPAVYSTYRLLLTFDLFNIGLLHRREMRIPHPLWTAVSLLLAAGVGLAMIGVWPDFLFPLLWVSPLLIVTALQLLSGETHVFSSFFRGDWRVVITAPAAALICGLFWEMWNVHSLAKWEYAHSLCPTRFSTL